MKKYVVLYESAEDVMQKAPAVYPAHKARVDDFHSRGSLLMIGTFADVQDDGSMAVFSSREAAEEFVQGDPFVLQGVVSAWRIKEWNETLTNP